MGSVNEVVQKASFLRGSFINDIVFLERVIDEFICRHFCQDNERKIELIEFLIATKRVTFDSKLSVAKFIIEKHHKEFGEKYKNWFPEITKIIEHRNVFAHSLLDTSDEGIEIMKTGVIQFLKFEKTTKPITYTNLEIEEIDKKLRLYVDAFGSLQ